MLGSDSVVKFGPKDGLGIDRAAAAASTGGEGGGASLGGKGHDPVKQQWHHPGCCRPGQKRVSQNSTSPCLLLPQALVFVTAAACANVKACLTQGDALACCLPGVGSLIADVSMFSLGLSGNRLLSSWEVVSHTSSIATFLVPCVQSVCSENSAAV